MVIKLLMLLVWLVLIPCLMAVIMTKCTGEQEQKSIAYLFPMGLMMTWGIFLLICVPFVLKQGSFFQVEKIVKVLYILLALVGFALLIVDRKSWKAQLEKGFGQWKAFMTGEKVIYLLGLIAFLASLLFQLYQSYHLAYADGDDAYYLSISTAANLGGGMYKVSAYTGVATTLDSRHGLAPFPIWVSFVSEVCGVNPAVAAHTLLPLVLIPACYFAYWLLGRKLIQNKAYLPLFLLAVSVLQIFGNYSIYPGSTFLLTRSRQGKAALASFIIPMLFYLLLQSKAKLSFVLELWIAILAACLCTTLGSMLGALVIGLYGLLRAITQKDFKYFLTAVAGCLPGIAVALLYVLVR